MAQQRQEELGSDYFSSTPRVSRRLSAERYRYLEFVPRVSSPLTSPPLSPDGDHESYYSDVFWALGIEGSWTGAVREDRDMNEKDGVREERGRLGREKMSEHRRSSSHMERLFGWRRSSATPGSPTSDDALSDDAAPDLSSIRRTRCLDNADTTDSIDGLRRDRDRRSRRWDPVEAQASSSRVTLAQLLEEELAYAHAIEMAEHEADRVAEDTIADESLDEKDEFEDMSAEGGSDESATSRLSGMWETGGSEESHTSHGHASLEEVPPPPRSKRGRSKLRRRRPPTKCAYRSRSEASVQKEALLGADGVEGVGCLPCSIGIRRSLRYWSFKLKLRRPEEISPALQALVERPMSPEEYHSYFLSLYMKEGEYEHTTSNGPKPNHVRAYTR